MIIREETGDALSEYGRVSIAFKVATQLRVELVDRGLGGLRLIEESVESAYMVDFDQPDDGPANWGQRWDISNWGILSAFDGTQRGGGATVAWRTQGVHMLEGRDDLAVLWDLRVDPACRRRGVGARLFAEAVVWAQRRNCRWLKVETQNTNVAACRFYAAQGCELRGVHIGAYQDSPEEVQLLWYLRL